MESIPQIVRDQLKAASSAVDHPDANVLTGFAEKSLPAKERTAIIEHLACCADCRDIVALAMPPTEAAVPVVAPTRTRWLTWPVLRWGFVAAGIVAVASVGVLQYQQRDVSQATTSSKVLDTEAKNESPAPPPVPAPSSKTEKTAPPADMSGAPTNARTNSVPPLEEQKFSRQQLLSNDRKTMGRTVPHSGPFTPYQQQAVVQQAPVPAPNTIVRQQDAYARATPSNSVVVEAQSAAPQVVTEDQNQEAKVLDQSTDDQRDYSKAKAPVPSSWDSTQPLYRMQRVMALPGQMVGYVVDSTGAVVSNVQVTVTTGSGRPSATTTTDAQGRWLIAGLPSGNYQAKAEAPGFQTTLLNLNYDAAHPETYLFSLNVGTVAETVAVSGAAPTIQTENADVVDKANGAHLAAVQPSQLPLNGRNLNALQMIPRWGITPAGGLQRSFDQGRTWQDVDVNSAALSSGMSMGYVTSVARAKESGVEKKSSAALVFHVVAANGLDVWAGGNSAALFHSIDAGDHWSGVVPSTAGAALTGDILTIAFPDSKQGRITTSTGEVWTTTNSGQTWQKQ
jgi:Carboxypeptidase regulatory-like domain/Photosynthesis system II assembly factor YCF48